MPRFRNRNTLKADRILDRMDRRQDGVELEIRDIRECMVALSLAW
jgi:hypothetical protein